MPQLIHGYLINLTTTTAPAWPAEFDWMNLNPREQVYCPQSRGTPSTPSSVQVSGRAPGVKTNGVLQRSAGQ